MRPGLCEYLLKMIAGGVAGNAQEFGCRAQLNACSQLLGDLAFCHREAVQPFKDSPQTGDDTLTTGLVSAGERDALSGGLGNDTLVFNGARVQADGGDGMDTFQFIDYDPGVGTQNAILFDVSIAEMDKIDVSDWTLGLTAADIAALATQGPSVNDSALSLDGGNLTMTIFGITTADLVTFADDIFIV